MISESSLTPEGLNLEGDELFDLKTVSAVLGLLWGLPWGAVIGDALWSFNIASLWLWGWGEPFCAAHALCRLLLVGVGGVVWCGVVW